MLPPACCRPVRSLPHSLAHLTPDARSAGVIDFMAGDRAFLPVRYSCSRAGPGDPAAVRACCWRPVRRSFYACVAYRNGCDQELSVLAAGAAMLAGWAIERLAPG